MGVDFRDLNKTTPKDNSSLPYIEILVDKTFKNALLSFIYGQSDHNEIMMEMEDMKNTTIIIAWGVYFYTLMALGLKNVDDAYK